MLTELLLIAAAGIYDPMDMSGHQMYPSGVLEMDKYPKYAQGWIAFGFINEMLYQNDDFAYECYKKAYLNNIKNWKNRTYIPIIALFTWQYITKKQHIKFIENIELNTINTTILNY